MPNAPRRIEVLAFPDVQLLDATGPLQVFATANDLARDAGENRPYDVMLTAATSPVRSSSGLEMTAMPLAGDETPLDTLVIAGGQGVAAAMRDAQIVAWVRRRAALARRTTSVCSGAFLLAETGLLDGRRATTHWQRLREFAARFPAVKLETDPIFVADGPIWTSAGVTAGIDLALALVEADLGPVRALAIARQLVVFLKRPGGQAQFSAALELQCGDPRFDALQAWIAANPAADLSLAALAARVAMSTRSFCRHFQAATGRTPARAVELIRVEAARRMLEQGHPVQRVAERSGFGSQETMRRSFLRVIGVGPQAYGERFR